jgi:hypothetical protein
MKKTGYVAEKYENQSNKNKENHIFALESDWWFSPRVFSIEADEANFNKISSWASI